MGRPRTISDDDILDAAREVFVREGAFGSTAEIARRAGVAEATLFKRFPTKAQLFLAAMVPPPADLDALLAEARGEPDPRVALQAAARALTGYFRMALPRIIPLMANPLVGLEAVAAHYGREQPAALTGAVAAFLEQRAGVAPGALFPAASLLVATAHSLALFEILGAHDGAIPEEGVDALAAALWDGVGVQFESKESTP